MAEQTLDVVTYPALASQPGGSGHLGGGETVDQAGVDPCVVVEERKGMEERKENGQEWEASTSKSTLFDCAIALQDI